VFDNVDYIWLLNDFSKIKGILLENKRHWIESEILSVSGAPTPQNVTHVPPFRGLERTYLLR